MVSWTGGPLTPSAAGCAGPDDPACDHFHLNIVPPGGGEGFTVRITLTPIDDWDLNVYDPDGSGEGTSGNPAGVAEIVVLSNPVAGVHTVSGAPFAVGAPYSATAVFELGPPPPPPPPPGTQGIELFQYEPPAGLGASAGEPSIGVGRLGAQHIPNAAIYIAGLRGAAHDPRRVRVQTAGRRPMPGSTRRRRTTVSRRSIRSSSPTTAPAAPSSRSSPAKCSLMSFSDDDGATWTPSQGCGINAGVDHQTVGGGPFPASDPLGGIGLSERRLLLLAGRGDRPVRAQPRRRADVRAGGSDLQPHPVRRPPRPRQGGAGRHGLRPQQELRSGLQGVAVSTDAGLTWTVHTVPGSASGDSDPLDRRRRRQQRLLRLATARAGPTSRSRATTARPGARRSTLGAAFGVLNTVFPEVVAGDGDRAALAFLGTTGPGSRSDVDRRPTRRSPVRLAPLRRHHLRRRRRPGRRSTRRRTIRCSAAPSAPAARPCSSAQPARLQRHHDRRRGPGPGRLLGRLRRRLRGRRSAEQHGRWRASAARWAASGSSPRSTISRRRKSASGPSPSARTWSSTGSRRTTGHAGHRICDRTFRGRHRLHRDRHRLRRRRSATSMHPLRRRRNRAISTVCAR